MTAAPDPMVALGAVGDPVALVHLDDACEEERAILAEPIPAPLSAWCVAATAGRSDGWHPLHAVCRAPGEVDIPGGRLRFVCGCPCHAELIA